MAALSPAILFADSEVFHARLGADGVRFRYRVTAIFVDLDRLDEPPAIPFFSLDRFNLFGFHVRDHGLRNGTCLRDHIDRLHREAELPAPTDITLIAFPRILGFVFNPIAVYCCRNAAGRPVSVAYEVRNTFGEQHTYLMPVSQGADGGILPHECDKIFHVSPFMDMPLRYRFLLCPPDQGSFSLKIIERDCNGVILTALMRAQAFSPTRTALLLRLLRTPLAGFKVLTAIHWQALRLWLKGHAIRPHPSPPPPVSVGTAGTYSLSSTNLKGRSHV